MAKEKNHSKETKLKALRYFIMGLNLEEISKLTDVKERTLELWQIKDKWTSYKRNVMDVKKRVYEMYRSGKSQKKISEIFECSDRTIRRYIAEYKKENIEPEK